MQHNAAYHFFLQTEPGHFLIYMICSAAIGSMPAPTSQSHMFYLWAFKFLNTLAANVTRAFATKIEASPNFEPAVNVQRTLVGQEPLPIIVPPTAEPPK